MNERVLAIVTIIAQYILSDHDFPVESDLITELLAAGFATDEIDAAFHWMEGLKGDAETAPQTVLRGATHRVFCEEECRLLSLEARGFLVRLRTLGLIDENVLEEVITRATLDADEEISLLEIKALAAQILFAHVHSGLPHELGSVLDDDWSGFLN